MNIESYLHLQNGSDVRGVALATADGANVNLPPETVCKIAAGFGLWLSKQNGKPTGELRVGVGHDSRLTADSLKLATLAGLQAVGVTGFDCGLASTPAMFMGTVFAQTDFDGSIMITASHLPKNRNGMKFFTRSGGLDKPDITALLEIAAPLEVETSIKNVQTCDLIGLYSHFLRQKIVTATGDGEKPLDGLHIVVDAGNGGGGFLWIKY